MIRLAVLLFIAAASLVIIAFSTHHHSTPEANAPPVIERICEDTIGKIQDHSAQDLDSIRFNVKETCFGPILKLPRTWEKWIFQEAGGTHPDSWLAVWLDGSLHPLPSARGGHFDSIANLGSAMRFAGRGSYLAIAIMRHPVYSAASTSPTLANPAPATQTSIDVAVTGNTEWTDTGVQLRSGETVNVSAAGSMRIAPIGHIPNIPAMPPAGYPPDCAAASREYGPFSSGALGSFPVLTLPCWSLIGRIGTHGAIFAIGEAITFHAESAGQLYLGINEDSIAANEGEWKAHITISPGIPTTDLGTISNEPLQPATRFQNHICRGAADGESGAVWADHSADDISQFTLKLQPGCFSGYILMPDSWQTYRMEATGLRDGWWMAYKWYQSRYSGSGERPPLTPSELVAVGQHTSQKIRVQGSGQLLFLKK